MKVSLAQCKTAFIKLMLSAKYFGRSIGFFVFAKAGGCSHGYPVLYNQVYCEVAEKQKHKKETKGR